MSDTSFAERAADLYRDLSIPTRDGRPFVAVNMVASVDGKAVVDGGAKALGSSLDRALMRRIRTAADCVLVGAATLRAEGYDAGVGPDEAAARLRKGRTAQPLAAVVTATGDLPARRGFFRVPGQRVLVVASSTAIDARRERFEALEPLAEVTVVACDVERILPGEILDVLYARFGVRRLLVEGGPGLVGELLAADLVDQLFITVSPRLVGGDERTIAEPPSAIVPARPLALLSASAEASFLYLRYEVVRYEVQH